MRIKVNDKFGEWVILAKAESKNKEKRWVCKCSCGKIGLIWERNLLRGLSKSCGKHPKYWQRKYFEYAKKIPEWNVWSNMKNRCENPKNGRYKYYGARGITICNRWKGENGFKNFYKDMGKRPSKEHTIERINNEGGYSPENCKWIPFVEQSKNRRETIRITFNNKTQTIGEWAKEIGMSYPTLLHRKTILKWTDEKAITTPTRKRHK